MSPDRGRVMIGDVTAADLAEWNAQNAEFEADAQAHVRADSMAKLAFAERVGANIKRIAKARGLSIAAVARDAYWDSDTQYSARKLQRQMKGSPVSTDDAAAIAAVLGVDPSAFYAPIAD